MLQLLQTNRGFQCLVKWRGSAERNVIVPNQVPVSSCGRSRETITFLFLVQSRRLRQEKPTLGSALIYAETFVWTTNITTKQRASGCTEPEEGMQPAGAYGAAKAGSFAFDPVAFITHPRTILRLMSWVFSVVVFSCIVNEGYINIGSERLLCVFNNNADACNYGVTVGVACFLGSIFFLILDIYFPSISSVKDRRRAVLLDLVFSGLASFLWFVGFCFLANQWQATSPDELPLAQGSDAARATIAFCFFSILTWGYQCLLAMNTFKSISFMEDKQRLLPKSSPTLSAVLTLSALRRFLTGSNKNLFTWQHLDPPCGNARATPYPIANGATIVTTNPYQAPPFTETLDPQKLTQQRPVAPAF